MLNYTGTDRLFNNRKIKGSQHLIITKLKNEKCGGKIKRNVM